MRKSPVHLCLTQQNAQFEERYGLEICSAFHDYQTEYDYIRNHVGISDFSFLKIFSIPEETGIDFLNTIFAGNVAKISYGRLAHTFLANQDGYLIADCLIANNDEEYIIFCESIIEDHELLNLLEQHGASKAGLQDITEDHVLLGIDGFKAWSVVRDLFSPDVLGLPYLSIEQYQFNHQDVQVIRAGKTSEFGYLILAPQEIGDELFASLLTYAQKCQGGLCGQKVHSSLRLEGRFFNIHEEGKKIKDPLPLGLQWMIDFDKDKFIGHEAIRQRRDKGLTHKIIGVRTDKSYHAFAPGKTIYDEQGKVAEIITTCYSPILDCQLGLALFPISLAYAGLQFMLEAKPEKEIFTISMPPIIPKSFQVKLDEL